MACKRRPISFAGDLLNDLLSRLAVPHRGKMPDFEALLEVKISSGVPVHSHLVAVRRHLVR